MCAGTPRCYVVDDIFCLGHTQPVSWTVEVTDEFEAWWNQLDDDQRISVDGMIRVLEARGPDLQSPYSIEGTSSRYEALRQLHIPHQDRTICVLYISDELRAALVLLTGATAPRTARVPARAGHGCGSHLRNLPGAPTRALSG
jgi:hypothetical protein